MLLISSEGHSRKKTGIFCIKFLFHETLSENVYTATHFVHKICQHVSHFTKNKYCVIIAVFYYAAIDYLFIHQPPQRYYCQQIH